jgi:hypothetical protein
MADALLEEFEEFFVELPSAVRNDLWFMMVMMSDETLVFDDPAQAYAHGAGALFQARTSVGRIGDMIYAASIFDIYFAMNAGKRFGSRGKTQTGARRYVERTAAIEASSRKWQQLRTTTFAPAAIAAALA